MNVIMLGKVMRSTFPATAVTLGAVAKPYGYRAFIARGVPVRERGVSEVN
jgi:hypothetical protein